MLHHAAVIALSLAVAGAGGKPKSHAKARAQRHPVERSSFPLGYVEVLGWTADGRYFAFQGNTELQGTGDDIIAVIDTHTGVELDYVDPASDAHPDPNPPPDQEAFKEWSKLHPILRATPSRTSPDGKARVDAAFDVPHNSGWGQVSTQASWKGLSWTTPTPSALTLSVTRGADHLTSLVYRGTFEGFQPYWAPDGRRVVYLITESNRICMNGGSDFVWGYVGPAQGATIQVLADPSRPATAPDQVNQALEASGFAPTLLGKAHDARAKTVVYAPAALKAVAARVAAAVPGGADVAELTWRAPADLVVALGGSVP